MRKMLLVKYASRLALSAYQTKIELVPVSSMMVMLFEDLSHGMMRSIYLKRGHRAKTDPTWLGDSVGRWEGTTLVVDTTSFNDQIWLNDEGAQHSDALHLVERIRPVLGGQYLEYKVTPRIRRRWRNRTPTPDTTRSSIPK